MKFLWKAVKNSNNKTFFKIYKNLCTVAEKENDCDKEIGGNHFTKPKRQISVGIIGGGMTPIYTAVLLKQSTLFKSINIVDMSSSLAAAIFDASHIDTKPKIKWYRKSALKDALSKVNIIALMDNEDSKILSTEPKIQLMMSSNYVRNTSEEILKINPSAIIAVFARPVTANLPLVSEVFHKANCWNPNKILGSVALDVMRIESMAARLFHLDPAFLSIPVVGGADPTTAVPLISEAKSLNHISQEHEKLLVNKLKTCDKDLEECAGEDFAGPAMSSGTAAARFIMTLARALTGEPRVTCCAYVRSNIMPFCRFFANEVEIDCNGIKNNFGLPKVSPIAINLIQRAIPVIKELSDMSCKSFENSDECSIKGNMQNCVI